MSDIYIPKIQSKRGQLFDSLFILVLVYVSLYIPLFLSSSAAPPAEDSPTAQQEVVTWQSLGVSPVEQEQWQKLNYDAKTAAAIINDKFDYTVNPIMLLITAITIIGYFVFMLRVSDKQYREVIKEKFDSATHQEET